MITKIKKFFTEITVELKKVSWPTGNELFGSTSVVLIGTAIMTIFLWICDSILSSAVHLVIR